VAVTAGGARLTPSGRVAADLTISEGGAEVRYTVYLRNKVVLQFISTDRGRAELAARLLRLAGVNAEVRMAGSGAWYVAAYTDELAAGRRELREAVAGIVREALARGWIGADKAGRWLRRLEKGCTVREGWPKYGVGLVDGALVVRYRSADAGNIEREVGRLKAIGLKEGVHFSAKLPEGGKRGYVSILKGGLAYAAWLSAHGSGEQRRLAAELVGYVLRRASEEGNEVYRKAFEVVEAAREVGSMRLTDVVKARAEVGGREHVVTVLGGRAEVGRSGSGRPILRIIITAEVDEVSSIYRIAFGRYGRRGTVVGYAVARADAPGGREADAERLAAIVKALTGREPKARRLKGGEIVVACYEGHLEGFTRYAELVGAIVRWFKEAF